MQKLVWGRVPNSGSAACLLQSGETPERKDHLFTCAHKYENCEGGEKGAEELDVKRSGL